MTNFKSKYVYPVLIFRILFFLVAVGSVAMFIFRAIPKFTKKHDGLETFGLLVCGVLYFGFFIIVFGKSILIQRYNISIKNGQTVLKDILFGKHIVLDENCKGFSLSSYGDNSPIYDFKVLIFYFSNGRKVECPQFLYTNFKHIMPALQEHSIHFLGKEPFRWKNLLFRRYHFD
jgi:hypothetical protein